MPTNQPTIQAPQSVITGTTLLHIADLQYAIATTPARTLPEAAVQLRRLAALFEGWDDLLRRLLLPDDDDGQTARSLLASALAAVEAGNG